MFVFLKNFDTFLLHSPHFLALSVLFDVNRVSGSPVRSAILPTKASGSTQRLTTRSTQPTLRFINTTASV